MISRITRNNFLVPGIKATFSALIDLSNNAEFYFAVLFSLLRVFTGLILGIIVGTFVAIISYKSKIVCNTVSPAVSIIKSTPVASFIVILWIMLNGSSLAIFISFLMVFPIIWQNTLDGLRSIDIHLYEVSKVFHFSTFKKMRLLYFPALLKFLVPAIITSVGLAWKSEIAAEIIAYTANSIGYMINESKTEFDTPKIFALTIVVIFMSAILELITKKVLRRIEN